MLLDKLLNLIKPNDTSTGQLYLNAETNTVYLLTNVLPAVTNKKFLVEFSDGDSTVKRTHSKNYYYHIMSTHEYIGDL